MQRTSTLAAVALFIIVGLIVADSAAASAGGRRPFALRLLCVVADILSASSASAAGPVRATGERVIVQRAEQPKPYLNLSNDAADVPVEYGTGTGVAELAGAISAHALASADFDEDGVPDLVSGYTGASGVGVITLERGNVDAIYPNSPEARERRERGNFNHAPFLEAASAFLVPEAASVVGAGDFDADGHWDVVAARRNGNALYFLRGDGRGNLAKAERVDLPGALTAFTTGEMNRRDGLTDIVVAINGNSGASVLVFESPAGALRGQPEALSLQAPASDLALGALDADAGANDLAIAAGKELLVIHGRDRRLSLGAESRTGVAKARVSRTTFEFTLAAVAVGDFAGDERADVAVLSTDGAVQVLTRARSEKSARAMNAAQTNNAQPKQLNDEATDTIEWQRSTQISVVESTTEVSGSAHVLVTAKVSSLGKDDLLLLSGGRAHVITNEPARVQTGEKAKRGETGNVEVAVDLRVAGSVAAESKVAAVLPMRLNSSGLSSLVVLGMDSKAPSVVSPAAAVTFTVDSSADTDDANPGNGECKDANGNCTLRAALRETISNADAGPFTINFNISGAGVPTISTSGFFNASNGNNTVSKPVVIDGTTQAAGRVEIIDTVGHGGLLHIAGGNSTLRGLVMSGAASFGGSIVLGSGNNIIEDCYIGTNADATAVAARRSGAGISVNGSNNRIGGTAPAARNVISGATDRGIEITAGSGNLIEGNYIGTNAAGTAALGNGWGIVFNASANTVGGTAPGAGNLISGNGARENRALWIRGVFATVQGNLFGTDASGDALIGNTGDALYVESRDGATTIGGTTPAARNVIAGSTGRGIYIDSANSTALIQGNYIGTNADGTVALPNLSHGILLGHAGITVGGTVPSAGNLISGNGGDGIHVNGQFNTVQGNLIGTDVSGTLALPNASDGVEIQANGTNGARGNLIGGTAPEARNVISGNRDNGINFNEGGGGNPNRAEGNYIGTNRFGTGALGNGQHGIYFSLSQQHNVGGTSEGASNLIAHNNGAGIASSRDHIGGAVFSNSIHSNAELGIDIADDGVSPDSSVHTGSRRPTLVSVTNTDAGTVIMGTIPNHNSSTPFTIQFFSNPACDPSGHGEGQTLIGETAFTPAQNTTVNFSHTVSPAVPGGTFITAVAVRQADGQLSGVSYSSEFSNCAPLAAPTPTPTPTPGASPTPTPTPTPAPLQLFAIAPNRGGDNGSVTSRISGQALQEGAAVRLVRSGQADIAGSDVSLDQGGSILIVTFDLKGKARGVWDVVVTNPDGGTGLLPAAFTIEEGRDARTWVDIIGRDLARPGREQTWLILYGNRGNVDANGVMLAVSIPADTTYTVGSRVGVASPADVDDPDHKIFPAGIDWSQHPDYLESDEEKLIPFIIPIVPAGATGVIQLRVTFPSREGSFELQAMITEPFLESSLPSTGPPPSPGSAQAKVRGRHTPDFEDPLVKVRQYRKWVKDKLAQNYIKPDGSIDFDRLNSEYDQARADFDAAQDRWLNNGDNNSEIAYQRAKVRKDRASEHITFARMAETSRAVFNAAKSAKDFVEKTGEEVIDGVKKWAQDMILEPVKAEFEETKRQLLRDLKKKVWPAIKKLPGRIIASRDPNEKIGARGAGTRRFISGEEPLRYAVFFENIETATAAAQDVIITDQLDVSTFDLSTFQLGPISFGARLVEPPPGLSEWTTDVDLRPANNLIVRVSAKLDKATGVVRWKFVSLDPATMLPTEDPLAGFLPPNRTSPEGEGNVFFTVAAKEGIQTGAEVRNGARIVFDQNPHIDTPVWLNTIDNSRPTSQVSQLAATQPYIVFDVNWSGTDTGSGVEDYTVFVSENDGPYAPWSLNTTSTSGIFAGKPGKTYSFYTVARDKAGNVEQAKTSPEATTTTPNVVVNAVDDARFFVLQHYRAFLGRDPDPAGFDFWTNQIASCGTDVQCIEVKRINVSVSFFLSIEFQQTGYLVERSHKTTFGEATGNSTFGGAHTLSVPSIQFTEYLIDTQLINKGVIVLQPGWEQLLENNKQCFFLDFVQRSRFTTALPTTMTPAEFVDKLNQNAGNVLSASERTTAINLFGGAANTTNTTARAQALRQVAEDQDLHSAEFNRAFVLMQYFGYLGRNPNDPPDTDYSGYDFWLTKLNQFNGNHINAEMVKAFLTSIEYRQRFGP